MLLCQLVARPEGPMVQLSGGGTLFVILATSNMGTPKVSDKFGMGLFLVPPPPPLA